MPDQNVSAGSGIAPRVTMPKKEAAWHIKEAADTAELRGRCIKLFARNARKSARSHSNQERTALYTAKNAFQSAKIADVKVRIDPQKIAF